MSESPAREACPPALLSRRRLRPGIYAELGPYRMRMAETAAEREQACRLRFKVFNIELGEGLASSYRTGIDTDRYDPCCEHLIVEERSQRRIVGTYRMQSGETARQNCGYYSEQEFDFRPYEPLRAEILELGRASIDREHRSSEVLTLLWRGISQYALDGGLRYLLGCSSLTSQDPQEGWRAYRKLESFLAPPELRTRPSAAYACPAEAPGPGLEVKVPKLLKTYLAVGARICAPPAWDREFGTIDFLTLVDLSQLSSAARRRFVGR